MQKSSQEKKFTIDFIISSIGLPSDLPWHTRIGIGHHARRFSVEELFLLHDAFFRLVSAEQTFANMDEAANKIDKQADTKLGLNDLYLANSNVAAYSRLGIISFFSFIEAFVNSVGHDFYLHNLNLLTSGEIEILQGKKKARLVSVEYKIENTLQLFAQTKSPLLFYRTIPK